ncbi:unnamed protein product [Rotaria socialis]|uniref:FYVE-type domain-containing protein n=1 Tax=Rotaria socialis TaxID=392032 RepID=A0A817NFB7_9BILA|nr:unnamed protein product [Rotaria socialis]CAF3442202.1 unnamed protein product [Rotaria socialis]
MSTQDIHKLSSVLRSIEIIEEKTNILHSQYAESLNETDNQHSIIIDDSNIHLQLFFQHFEQLLQLDIKNRKSLLNTTSNKQSYWNFFSVALKESKALYDTVLYVLNSQEVKTSTGRGRLFLRFCLQNHRLGDVVQHSFMMTKTVNQFYIDECFWTTPSYMNRIVQALYQLNDLRYDLLSKAHYQLDICWPTAESTEHRPKTLSDAALRMRNISVSSLISMSSVDSQSIVSNLESSINDGSAAQSLSSVDEDPENTIIYWKQKYHELEMQLQTQHPSNDVEIQCSSNENGNSHESTDKETVDKLNSENEKLQIQINSLNEEISNLNLQLLSAFTEPSTTTTTDTMKDYESQLAQYQSEIENKDILINELQQKYAEQTQELQLMQEQNLSYSNEQNQQIELLKIELEKSKNLLEDERLLMENERNKRNTIQEKLEITLQERTLDFEEMKRRLVKAVREKAELFDTMHSYEIKLEEQQAKKWVPDEEVLNCTECNIVFGWTVRKHHCRHCQKIFCYNCSNNWIQGPKANSPQCRVCDQCNEILLKESLMPNGITQNHVIGDQEIKEDIDLHFEVRAECLPTTTTTTDIQSTS